MILYFGANRGRRSSPKMFLEVTLGCFRLLNVAFLGCSMLLEVFFENFPHATFSNLLFATSGNLKQLYVTLRNLRYFCSLYPEPRTLYPENVTSHHVTGHQLRSAVPFGSPAPQIPSIPVHLEINWNWLANVLPPTSEIFYSLSSVRNKKSP